MSESPVSDRSRERDSRNGWGKDKSEERGRSRDRVDRRDKDPENFTQIYIAKLSRNTNESDVRDAFSKYGQIKSLVLKHSYAFVDFDEHEAAERAVKDMNGKTFVSGEELVVE